MEVLTRCRHNGFPVVRSGLGDDEDSGDFDAAGQGASRSGSLQGIILRSQILVMLRHQVSARAGPSRWMPCASAVSAAQLCCFEKRISAAGSDHSKNLA